MKIKEFLKSAGDKVLSVFKRFPVSIICFAILTIMFIARADFEPWNVWFLCIGAVLSLSMDNWRETCGRTKLTSGVTIAAYFIHILITVLLFFFHKSANDMHGVALTAIASAVVLSLFCLPYLRQKNDMPLWHFVFQTGIALGISCIFTATLCGGLTFILFAFDHLFDFQISSRIYSDILVISAFFVWPVLFMAFIPSGADKVKDDMPSGKSIGDKLVHYVIMPLFGVYLFVLYLYIISILVHWNLPKGMISLLVSSAMAVALFLILRIYPAGVSENTSFDKKLLKYIPVAMLPLLVLMSVGIFRRVADYGLTTSRAYLILFNLWCYAVCIYLLKTHARRVIWIPVSFGLIFLATSVLPLNITQSISWWSHHLVASQLEKSGIQSLPLNQAAYHSWMQSLDDKTRDEIQDRLLYMSGHFNSESYADLIGKDVDLWWVNMYADDSNTDEAKTTEAAEPPIPLRFKTVRIFMNKQKSYMNEIRCSSMFYMDNIYITSSELDVNTGAITFSIVADSSDQTDQKYTFYINRALIENGEANMDNEAFLVLKNEVSDLYISSLTFDYFNKDDKLLRVSGVLCVKSFNHDNSISP